jgi:exopolysaccharide biosynthesis protein
LRQFRRIAALGAFLLLISVVQPVAAQAQPQPDLAIPGVSYGVVTVPGPTTVHVVRFSSTAPVELRAVSATSSGVALERPSHACARVGCLAAINADFFSGNTKLPLGGMVIDGNLLKAPAPRHAQLSVNSIGDLVHSRGAIPTDAMHSLGASYLVARDGQPTAIDERTPFTLSKQARTLVGWNNAGETLLVVVDKSSNSKGLTLLQAGELLVAQGATHAVNLDGGGSSTLVVQGDVKNSPSRGEQRVPNMWMLMPAAKPAPVPGPAPIPAPNLIEELLKQLGF